MRLEHHVEFAQALMAELKANDVIGCILIKQHRVLS